MHVSATTLGYPSLVKTLCDAGANVKLADHAGNTPL